MGKRAGLGRHDRRAHRSDRRGRPRLPGAGSRVAGAPRLRRGKSATRTVPVESCRRRSGTPTRSCRTSLRLHQRSIGSSTRSRRRRTTAPRSKPTTSARGHGGCHHGCTVDVRAVKAPDADCRCATSVRLRRAQCGHRGRRARPPPWLDARHERDRRASLSTTVGLHRHDRHRSAWRSATPATRGKVAGSRSVVHRTIED